MAFGTGQVLTNAGKAITVSRLMGSGIEPKYVGVGVGAATAARTAAIADTQLSSPVDSRGTGNSSSVTITTTNDTYQVIGSVVAGAVRDVDEAGLFDALTAGNMFMSATFPAVHLQANDTIQMTMQVKYA